MDARRDRSAGGQDENERAKQSIPSFQNGTAATFVNAQCCSQACSLVNPNRAHKPHKQHIRMQGGGGGGGRGG